MTLLPVDYVYLGLALLLTVLGLFRGFSGAFAFLSALGFAAAAVFFGWSGFLASVNPSGLRIVAAVLLFLVLFGLVRLLVKKIVGKMLSQPSDSIFGIVLGLACSVLLLWGVAQLPALRDYSMLAQEVDRVMNPRGEAPDAR